MNRRGSRWELGGCSRAEHERHQDLWAMFPLMVDVLPEAKAGGVEIYHFEVSAQRAEVNRYTRNELWTPGKFCQLRIDGVGWMYDSLHERCMNRTAVEQARGDVLIAGLGLGMILWPILAKWDVTSVTVIENNPEVVALVLPTLASAPGRDKLTVTMADALTWAPDPGQVFDYAWLDCVPGYGYSLQTLRMQERWIKQYRPFMRDQWNVDHWGYQECLLHLLDDQAEIKRRGYPIGPPCPMAAALAESYGIGGTYKVDPLGQPV